MANTPFHSPTGLDRCRTELAAAYVCGRHGKCTSRAGRLQRADAFDGATSRKPRPHTR